MPPESLWKEYSLIGILVLAAGVIAAAFYRLWHELLAWLETQDKKREIERDKQREWEAEQMKLRDAQWQAFIQAMQDGWLEQNVRNSDVLKDVVEKINDLTIAMNNHDTWVRAQNRK